MTKETERVSTSDDQV